MIPVCVVGAGVIGLSSAVRIQDTLGPSVRVTVIADKFSPNTTSDGSGGFWEPHLLNEGQSYLIRRWGGETFDYLLHLSRLSLASKLGVQLVSGYNFTDSTESPDWKDQVFGYRTLSSKELSLCPGAKSGSFYTTLIIDVKAYLPWLLQKLKTNGGRIVRKKITSLEELFTDFEIIVNCTGLGSYTLVRDSEMNPIRGQVTKVKAPWLKHFMIRLDPTDSRNEIYILPGSNYVTLGGTGQVGDWNEEVSAKDKQRIWKGCLSLAPSLRDAEIIEDWVGLRPHRSSVRMEMETRMKNGKKKMVIHNYGHSGSGVTLHWGCANETANLTKRAVEIIGVRSNL